MTRQNSLKRLVRARMADTGQSYTTARRIVLSQLSGERFGGVVADGYLRPRSQADRGAGRAAHGRPRPYPQAAQPAAQPRQRRAGRPTFSARSRPACAPTAASTAWRAATTPSARPGGTWPLRALPGGVPLLAETRALLDRRDAAFAAEARTPATSCAASGPASTSSPTRQTTASRSTPPPSTSCSAACNPPGRHLLGRGGGQGRVTRHPRLSAVPCPARGKVPVVSTYPPAYARAGWFGA
jgi:hypothetical protein